MQPQAQYEFLKNSRLFISRIDTTTHLGDLCCASSQSGLDRALPNSTGVFICDAKGEENGVRQCRQAFSEGTC